MDCVIYHTLQTAIYELARHFCRCHHADDCDEMKSAKYLSDLLNSMGVDVDCSSSKNNNALMEAIVKGSQDTALMLIRAGADINLLHTSKSYMHLASEYGCNEVIQLLIEKGANFNLTDCVSAE